MADPQPSSGATSLPTEPGDPRLDGWYHTIELGGGLVSRGYYDHRPVVDSYGLPPSLEGMTALDVGTGDGFFAFEMERRGAARVLAVDLPKLAECDWVPRMRRRLTADTAENSDWPDRFRMARRLLGSAVEYEFCSVYELSPERLGTFDVVFCGSLLLHLQDPLRALHAIRSVTGGIAVIETAIDAGLESDPHRRPLLAFGSLDREQEIGELNSYWLFTTQALEHMMLYADFDPVQPQPAFELPPRGLPVTAVVGHAAT